MSSITSKTVDEWLNGVSYVNDPNYVPTDFALEFVTFIKLVNGEQGEEHKTPVLHYRMLDRIGNVARNKNVVRILNMIHRGAAKSTIMGEYLFLYLAVYGNIPNFGKIELALYVSDSVDNGVKTMRKNLEFRWENSDFLQKYVPKIKFTDIRWEFHNIEGNVFIVKGYGATTGVRGTREMGKRPKLAVLDDLVSDEDARSETVMNKIRDTAGKAIEYALHPSKNMVIWSGTPFNQSDPLYEAAESGAWDVNVFPVCEKFPCEEKEFRGSWEDRFTYEYVKTMYDKAVMEGTTAGFNQEMMLRILSDDDRLIQDADIRWYKLDKVLQNRGNFNFYITTDYTVSEKQHSDYSVTSIWAYNYAGDFFWVDGKVKRQTIDKSIEDLFNYVQIYKPMGVGIEVSGQQEGFIPWIMDQMMTKNCYFNIVSHGNSNRPGIRPNTSKLIRFNTVVPLFKAGKMYFPLEKKTGIEMSEMMNELSLASIGGLKAKHDDFIDTISMLPLMKTFRPSEESTKPIMGTDGIWAIDTSEDDSTNYSNSYVV
jgi:phage terminase large subunit-like protein